MSILQQPAVSALRRERLAAGAFVHLHEGGRLAVLAGRVWLTNHGDRRDHFLDAGESIELAPPAEALLESCGGDAVIAWQAAPAEPRREENGARAALCRCWELMNPIARIGLGASAAIAALLLGGPVFGPLSQARLEALVATPTSLHNRSHIEAGPDAATMRHVDPSRLADRARFAAQEARRRAAGAA